MRSRDGWRRPFLPLSLLAALAGGVALHAQIEGERGVPPIDSSANYEVTGILVDTSARTAEQARMLGWRLAQRRGWARLWARANGRPEADAPRLSDGALDALVAGIAVEQEQIGATRYIARLGILFDRSRTGELIGSAGNRRRSAPMLVIPVQWSGGTVQSFEARSDWQKAWARFRTGNSPIDYVRPIGNAADPLLLTSAQVGRRDRGWWRMLLDQYGATGVVVPEVHIDRAWPGGPVTARFVARHGVGGAPLAAFALSTPTSEGLAAMLDEGVRRIDEAYVAALYDGRLGKGVLPKEEEPEPLLAEAEALIDENAAALPGAASTMVIQADTPDGFALDAAETMLKGLPGVRSVATDSLALGGLSVLRVAFDGDPQALRAAIEARGYAIEDGGAGLRIRKR